jgi:hypothetical protein
MVMFDGVMLEGIVTGATDALVGEEVLVVDVKLKRRGGRATPFHVVALSVLSFVIRIPARLVSAWSWTGMERAGRAKAGSKNSGRELEGNMISKEALVNRGRMCW